MLCWYSSYEIIFIILNSFVRNKWFQITPWRAVWSPKHLAAAHTFHVVLRISPLLPTIWSALHSIIMGP